MALVTTININLNDQIAILTSTKDGDSVELITYDNSTQQVTFDSRLTINIDFIEFLSFCDQINIFQKL